MEPIGHDSDYVIDMYLESPEKGGGLLNGRLCEIISNYKNNLELLVKKPSYGAITQTDNCASDLLQFGTIASMLSACCCLFSTMIPIIFYRQQVNDDKDNNRLVLLPILVFWGAGVLFGVSLIGFSYLRACKIQRSVLIRNDALVLQIAKIKQFLQNIGRLDQGESAGLSTTEKAIEVFQSIINTANNLAPPSSVDISQYRLISNAEVEIGVILNSLSYQQVYQLYQKYSIDEKEIFKFLNEKPLENLKLLIKPEENREPCNIALIINFLENAVFIKEPEMFALFWSAISQEAKQDKLVNAAYQRVVGQIDMSAARLAEKNDFLKTPEPDVEIVVGDAVFLTWRSKLEDCEAFKPRLHPDTKFAKGSKQEASTGKLILNIEDVQDFKLFGMLISSLNQGVLTFEEEYLVEMLEFADSFGALPVIGLCQKALLGQIESKLLADDYHDWQPLFNQVIAKGYFSRAVTAQATKIFDRLVQKEVNDRNWIALEKLFDFGNDYRFLEGYYRYFDPDIDSNDVGPQVANIAFKYNLSDFRRKIEGLLTEKIKKTLDINDFFKQYGQIEGLHEFVCGQIALIIDQQSFKDIWELTEELNERSLKAACLNFAKNNVKAIYALWDIDKIPSEIAKCLLNVY